MRLIRLEGWKVGPTNKLIITNNKLSSPIFHSNSDWGIAITGEVVEVAPNHHGRT